MRTTRMASLGALAFVAACSGDGTNPLGGGGGTAPEGGASFGSNLSFNAGDTLYTLQSVRRSGNTLIVQGLPFDGDDSYADSGIRLGTNSAHPQLVVYKADPDQIDDSYDGGADGPIYQHSYIAVYAGASSGDARAVVTRTGSYYDHGFNGYGVGRDIGTTLPVNGQANYRGNYGALRTFGDTGGIQMVDGQMEMEVDFEKLNDNGAVSGTVFNRTLRDENGNSLGPLSDLYMTVQAGGLQDNGQFEATIRDENDADPKGTVKGMFVGNEVEEVVGIVDYPYDSDQTVEVGAFALHR